MPGNSTWSDILNNAPSLRDFIAQVFLIAFFYLSFYYIIPRFYFNKKYLPFFLLLIASFLVVTLLPSLLTGHFPFAHNSPPHPPLEHQPPPSFGPMPAATPLHREPPQEPNSNFIFVISHDIFLFFLVFFFSLNLNISSRYRKMQQEKADAELSYLKAQINPHFLFNTLNSIYALAIKKSDDAPAAIVKVSEMMRYVLYEADKDFVPLKKEMNYITNYIRLQEMRFKKSVSVSYETTGTPEGKKIAPLLLITFIENAFKYGVNPESESLISIVIAVNKNDLKMEVHNQKFFRSNATMEAGGIGIENARKRLDLLYGAGYSLLIKDNAEDFFVSLKMNLL